MMMACEFLNASAIDLIATLKCFEATLLIQRTVVTTNKL